MVVEKKRLTEEDWKHLFPNKTFMLGKTEVTLRPLSLTQLAMAKELIETLVPELEKKGISRHNYHEPENLIFLAGQVTTLIPGLLSEITGVHQDDLQLLPIEIVAQLLEKIITMNLESKEGLEKNFAALGNLLKGVGPKASVTQFNDSSEQDIDGVISKVTQKGK